MKKASYIHAIILHVFAEIRWLFFRSYNWFIPYNHIITEYPNEMIFFAKIESVSFDDSTCKR